MNNSIWPSETWGEHPDDFFQSEELESGVYISVRVRRRENGMLGSMLTRVVGSGGRISSEHIDDVSDKDDYQAAEAGLQKARWLAESVK